MTVTDLPRGLWRHPGFAKLWAAQTISGFGDQITVLALPLLAATTLGAGAGQMGVLRAAETGPILIVGLFAGVWIDRLRRRPILIAADFIRAVLLLAIPLASWLDLLQIELLYVVAILVGTGTVFYDVARQSYVTSVVRRDQLVDANSKLMVSDSASEVIGPGIAGVLVQIVGAPATILLDAVSFALSGGLIGRIRTPEAVPLARRAGSNIWREMREGLHYLVRDPILRTLVGATGSGNIFENARYAVLVLFMSDELSMSPAAIGIVFAAGSIGYFLGAFLPAWTARRLGLGRAITGSMVVLWISEWFFPLAAISERAAVPLLIGGLFLGGLAGPSYDVNQVSLRQAITPDAILGRVNASARVIVRGAVPIGALLGGLIGELFGLRAVMLFGAFGGLSSLLWLWRSPVPGLGSLPPHGGD
jgi:MFS family permease